MTAVRLIGFEYGSTESSAETANVGVHADYARSGGYGLHLTQIAAEGAARSAAFGLGLTAAGRIDDAVAADRWVTIWLRFTQFPTQSGNGSRVLAFGPNTTPTSAIYSLFVNSGGQARIVGSGFGSVFGTMVTNEWHRFDFKVPHAATSGGAVRFDGGSETSIASNNQTLNYLLIGGDNSSADFEIEADDIWIDDADYAPDSFDGIEIAVPTADGVATHWAASTGDKWSCIDEIPPSGADYISSQTTAGDRRYSAVHESAATLGISSVLAVQVVGIMREASSTTTLGGVGLHDGTSSVDETTTADIGSTTEIPIAKCYELNPFTAAAWDVSGFDDVEPLVRRSTSDTSDIRCTALYLLVAKANTPPTFSVQPGATYATRTRTGPVNTWGVTFTATDAEQTGAGELSYEIRTSLTPGAGTLIASGTCTSGVSLVRTGLAYNIAGLAQGSNSLYVHVSDGAEVTVSNAFTLLRDDSVTAPANVVDSPDPTPDGDYAVAFDAPDTFSTGTNEMAWQVRDAASGGGNLVASGTFTQGTGKSTGTFTDAFLGFGWNARYLRILDGAANAAETSFEIILQQPKATSENAAINTTETVATIQQQDVAAAEDAAINAAESLTLEIQEDVAAAEDAAINATESVALAADVVAAEDAAINTTESVALVADLATAESAGVNTTEAIGVDVVGDFPPRSLRIDVYNAAGTVRLGAGPIVLILDCEYADQLGEMSYFRFVVPAADPRSDVLSHKRQIWLYREAEGLVFKGVIEVVATAVADDGSTRLVVSGYGIEAQLRATDTKPGREFSEASIADVVDELLALVGGAWSRGSTAARFLTYRPESVSVFEALRLGAEATGAHLRADNLTQVVDVDDLGDASGLVFANVEHLPIRRSYRSLYEIADLTVDEESADLYNRVILFGAGEGAAALTLAESDRVTPYTIQNDTGPDGRTYHYIEDAASIAEYGPFETTRRVPSIAPLANTIGGRLEASNTLYDVGAAWLERVAQVRGTYTVRVIGLRHVNPATGAAYFKVGQKVRVAYRGIAQAIDGTRTAWKTINADLWLMGFRRAFDQDGADVWDLTVSSVDRPQATDDEVLADVVAQVKALSATLRPYVANLYHSLRGSADATYPLDVIVDFDSNVQYLIQAKARYTLRAVRAPATGVASGGGATSGSGSAHTHGVSGLSASSGGGSTSGSGAAHSHTFGGGSTGTDGSSGFNLPGHLTSWWDSDVNSAGHTHAHGDPTTGANSVTHIHTTHAAFSVLVEAADANHTHSVSGGTGSSESSHTHTTPDHTHSVTTTTSDADTTHTHTTPAHTHALSFGIYEGSAPSAPSVGIVINGTDRTAALGGPWTATTDEIDITAYLEETTSPGQPLRQSNTVRFTVNQLVDVDVVIRSLVTAAAIAPG